MVNEAGICIVRFRQMLPSGVEYILDYYNLPSAISGGGGCKGLDLRDHLINLLKGYNGQSIEFFSRPDMGDSRQVKLGYNDLEKVAENVKEEIQNLVYTIGRE